VARKPRTVLEVCVAKQGIHKGALTAARVAQYAICAADIGHFPGAGTYADWWAIDERTAWRHRASIRDVFGDDLEAVVMALVAQMDKSSRSPRAVMALEPA